MTHIFISYAKKDTRELALALYIALNEMRGLSAWMDRSLETGTSWASQIQNEIDRADYVVVLLSPDVNRSTLKEQQRSFVLNEIDYAQQDNKPIIPVMVVVTRVPVQIAGIQYVDLTSTPNDHTQIVRQILKKPNINLNSSPASSLSLVDLPGPLATVEVPVTWNEVPDKTYSISKYPITNAQFASFKKDGGYLNQEWWLPAGWVEKESQNWQSPRYWHDPKWNSPSHPVIGVSWHEARAFTRWYSRKVGEKIDLLTEKQWLYAAQGGEDRLYPWGVNWDTDNCNSSAGSVNWNRTTIVTQYEGLGDSPFGAVDMLGNVWEWCKGSDQGKKPLRGGCWRSTQLNIYKRTERRAILSYNLWGFRLANLHK